MVTLRFAEEITLLMLCDEDGVFVQIPNWATQCVYAGAVLMDLAVENRIDSDPKRLTVIDRSPTGDFLLDSTLARIAFDMEIHDVRYWVDNLRNHADEIRERALARLVARNILRLEKGRFLWVFESHRYPLVDGEAEREVRQRIMALLFGDEIPDPRDIAIVCLADACDIFRMILSAEELERASKRIGQVRKLDLIGQAISKAVEDIHSAISRVVNPTF